jgi:hypothetical protein
VVVAQVRAALEVSCWGAEGLSRGGHRGQL